MLACDGVRAVVQGAVAVALLTDAMEVWMFVVAATIAGAATAFFGPASTGLVPETISPARLQQANAVLSFSQSATEVLGPASRACSSRPRSPVGCSPWTRSPTR